MTIHEQGNRLLRNAAAGILSLVTLTAAAVPAAPGYFDWEQPDGSVVRVRAVGDEYFHFYEDAEGRRMLPDPTGSLRLCGPGELERLETDGNARRSRMRGGQKRINTSYPTKGESRALVILVSFSDNDFTIDDPAETYRRMLNEEGFSEYSATGSARDYFLASSCGQFDIQFDVYGPVKLPGKMAYYGAESYRGHDSYPEEITINACIQLDDEIDFTQYDRDGDGEIDNVYIFYAGRGQASGGGSDTIWPHSADVFSGFNKTHKFDGLLLNHYAMSNEIDASASLSGIGTFCHEFSHVLGLPDFYATTYTSSFTCGTWSVMDYGPYLNDGHTPPVYGAYERYALGWLTPELLGDEPQSVRLLPITAENRAFMLPTERENEYFIFENRQQEGWDKYIPGHGMLVWHIDYYPTIWQSNSVNNNPNHLYVDIVEADGIREERNRDGDSFPGTAGVTEISDNTNPSLRSWSGHESGRDISRIREIDGELLFEYCGGNPPLEQVSGIAAKEIRPTRASIAWNPVDDAETYRVSLFKRDGERELSLMQYSELDTEGATEMEFIDLDYAADYRLEVVAENKWWRSLAGEGYLFRTADPTFDCLAPMPPVVSATAEDGFSVEWSAMEGAVGYEVMLFDRQTTEGRSETVDFEGQILADGWSSSATDWYKSTSYSGEAVPSLKMTSGDWIKSPVYDADIAEISVWHRSSLNTDDQYLTVLVKDIGGSEVLRLDVPVSRVAGGVFTILSHQINGELSSLPGRSVEFLFSTGNESSLAVDDISVRLVGEITDTPLQNAETSGSALSYTFGPLTAGQRYWCKVRGIDSDGIRSQWSAPVSYLMAEGLSVPRVGADSSGRLLYDLFGRRVRNPERGGIYVSSDKQKIIIK